MSLRILLISLSFILIVSCRFNQDQDDAILKQPREVVDRDPAKAILLTDSALREIRGGRINEQFSVPLLLVRQQAFSKLGMMDSVLATGVKIRELASSTGDSLTMAKTLLPVRGEISMADQQVLEPFLPGAARSFASAGMTYEEAVIEGLIGAIGTRKGDFTASMDHLYHAREILEGMDSIRPLYAVYMNIGNNRSAMGDHRASIGFYGRAADIAGRMNDSIRIASALMNEGIAFSSLKSFDSSRLRLNEALLILPARNGELAKLQILFNLATLSEKQGMLATAEADYRRVADGARGLGDPVAIGMANSGLAGVLGQTGRVGAAIRLMEGTIRQLDSIGLGHYALDLTDKLVSMYKLAGRYPEALAASEHRKLLMDSLISVENRTSVRELEVKYQTALKAAENLKLKQEARVRNLVGIGLLLIVAALIPLMLVLRQRNRYHRALNGTYERLISDYRRQRDEIKGAEMIDLIEEPMGEGGEEGTVPDAPQHSTSEEDMAIYNRMLVALDTQKLHLDPHFKSEDIAKELGISPRKLSQVIKISSGQTFTQFINRLRIGEATRLMERPHAGPLKIDAIAGMCGFSNRQHFRRVFEQVTGVTPGFFRKSVDDPASE